ncbi:MAG: hypothetical protein WCP91_03455, partial [Candidatus Berkelbacteria bacterium]
PSLANSISVSKVLKRERPFARIVAQSQTLPLGVIHMPCAAHSQAQQVRESRAKRNVILIAIGVSAAILAVYAICYTFFGHNPSFFERLTQ